MKKNTQCKTITREELVEVLKPYPEYEVSQHQLNVVYPNKYIITGVDDRITVYTKKDAHPTPIYEQIDTPPEGTEVYPDTLTFLKALIEHVEYTRFNHFDYRVPISTMTTLLEFALAIKDDFLSEFNGSCNSANLFSVMGRPYSGYMPLQDGGYEITEQYFHSLQDPSFHLTKKQTAWGSREADKIIEGYQEEYQIPEDIGIDYDSPEFQDWESAWCEDFQCQLTVKVFVLSDTTPEIGLEVFITYGNDVEEILIDRLISPSELNTSYIEQLKIEINLLNC
jgi:hypothetical protein